MLRSASTALFRLGHISQGPRNKLPALSLSAQSVGGMAQHRRQSTEAVIFDFGGVMVPSPLDFFRSKLPALSLSAQSVGGLAQHRRQSTEAVIFDFGGVMVPSPLDFFRSKLPALSLSVQTLGACQSTHTYN